MKTIIIELHRIFGDAETTVGQFIDQGKHQCFCIEDEYHRIKQAGDTRIPEGVYELKLVSTPKWSGIMGHPMIWIEVPGYTGVLIHPLNNERQTEGCLGPAESIGYDFNIKSFSGINSRVAYGRLYNLISERIKKAKEKGEVPYIQILSKQWNPYDEDPETFTVIDPPVWPGSN